MNHVRFSLIAILLCVFSLAMSPAFPQTVGAGPYYATPSWDQQLQCDTQATCPRFIVLANWRDANFPSGGAAVLDRETGLVWERSPNTSTFDWQSAQTHCNELSVGNRIGWRLPTLQELASLVDRSQSGLPLGHPFNNIQSSAFAGQFYWSATTFAAYTSSAWGVAFGFGSAVTDDKSINNGFQGGFVWCVRGGQGVDPQ